MYLVRIENVENIKDGKEWVRKFIKEKPDIYVPCDKKTLFYSILSFTKNNIIHEQWQI